MDKYLVFRRIKFRVQVLRYLKEGMKNSPEKYLINQEIFRQGIWNRRFGIKGVKV